MLGANALLLAASRTKASVLVGGTAQLKPRMAVPSALNSPIVMFAPTSRNAPKTANYLDGVIGKSALPLAVEVPGPGLAPSKRHSTAVELAAKPPKKAKVATPGNAQSTASWLITPMIGPTAAPPVALDLNSARAMSALKLHTAV